mmetsp:Transcript_10789/g.30312  ORF Transcript_10789/g.30312 Transcript_10789/m.30312 type:complete len:148 (-) Transcript_10789:40-483(-)
MGSAVCVPGQRSAMDDQTAKNTRANRALGRARASSTDVEEFQLISFIFSSSSLDGSKTEKKRGFRPIFRLPSFRLCGTPSSTVDENFHDDTSANSSTSSLAEEHYISPTESRDAHEHKDYSSKCSPLKPKVCRRELRPLPAPPQRTC